MVYERVDKKKKSFIDKNRNHVSNSALDGVIYKIDSIFLGNRQRLTHDAVKVASFRS